MMESIDQKLERYKKTIKSSLESNNLKEAWKYVFLYKATCKAHNKPYDNEFFSLEKSFKKGVITSLQWDAVNYLKKNDLRKSGDALFLILKKCEEWSMELPRTYDDLKIVWEQKWISNYINEINELVNKRMKNEARNKLNNLLWLVENKKKTPDKKNKSKIEGLQELLFED